MIQSPSRRRRCCPNGCAGTVCRRVCPSTLSTVRSLSPQVVSVRPRTVRVLGFSRRCRQSPTFFRDGILAVLRLGVNNGRAEGLNNHLRLIIPRAYGMPLNQSGRPRPGDVLLRPDQASPTPRKIHMMIHPHAGRAGFFVAAGRLLLGARSSARNQIPLVVCTSPREGGSTQTLSGRWASHSSASSKTWPHPPVRRQQCARSTPTQSVPQHDILGSCMADAQDSSRGRPAVMSTASLCSVAGDRRTPSGVRQFQSMRWTCAVGRPCWLRVRARSTARA
jgi:hypothetical protein